jgi:hypothetical protein
MRQDLEIEAQIQSDIIRVKKESLDVDNYISYRGIFKNLKKQGLYYFDNDGTISGRSGEAIIEKLLKYYEKLESQEEIALLEELLKDYRIVFRFTDSDGYIQSTRYSVREKRNELFSPDNGDRDILGLAVFIFHCAKGMWLDIFREDGTLYSLDGLGTIESLNSLINYFDTTYKQPSKSDLLRKLLAEYLNKFANPIGAASPSYSLNSPYSMPGEAGNAETSIEDNVNTGDYSPFLDMDRMATQILWDSTQEELETVASRRINSLLTNWELVHIVLYSLNPNLRNQAWEKLTDQKPVIVQLSKIIKECFDSVIRHKAFEMLLPLPFNNWDLVTLSRDSLDLDIRNQSAEILFTRKPKRSEICDIMSYASDKDLLTRTWEKLSAANIAIDKLLAMFKHCRNEHFRRQIWEKLISKNLSIYDLLSIISNSVDLGLRNETIDLIRKRINSSESKALSCSALAGVVWSIEDIDLHNRALELLKEKIDPVKVFVDESKLIKEIALDFLPNYISENPDFLDKSCGSHLINWVCKRNQELEVIKDKYSFMTAGCIGLPSYVSLFNKDVLTLQTGLMQIISSN